MIRLDGLPYVAVDTETTGLHWWEDKLFGISLTLPDRRKAYYDVRTDDVRGLQDELAKVPTLVFHNGKFDFHMLREAGIHIRPEQISDTLIRAALIDEHLLTYDLDTLGMEYVGIGKDQRIWQELADLFGGNPTKNAQSKNLPRAPRSLAERYANQDTDTTLALWEWQRAELVRQELTRVEAVEHQLLPVLIDCEHRGVRVDIDEAVQASAKLAEQIAVGQKQLDDMAGFPVNVNPSGSLKKLFDPQKDASGVWHTKDGTRLELTDSGGPCMDVYALQRMRMPEAKLVLSVRQMKKTRDTFIEGHILGHHHNGVIHANFNQTKSDNDLGTSTGRLSINDPALQQIHKRNKAIAPIVRSIFKPDIGQYWECHDYKQMDFRVFAHYTKSPPVMAAYAQNPLMDFHQMTADLTGMPRDKVPHIKGYAKAINLGNVFGMGGGKMAQEMGMDYTVEKRNGREFLKAGEEANALFERYHHAIPGIREFLKRADSLAKSRGYIRTALGRRIRFPGGRFTYKAGGLAFQGTAADCLKVKLVEVAKLLRGTPGRLLVNVHDEFDLSMQPNSDELSDAVQATINKFDGVDTPIKLDVPIRSDRGRGPNWWEASK